MKYKISKNGRKARRCNFFEEKEEYILPFLFDLLLDSIDYIEEVVPLD